MKGIKLLMNQLITWGMRKKRQYFPKEKCSRTCFRQVKRKNLANKLTHACSVHVPSNAARTVQPKDVHGMLLDNQNIQDNQNRNMDCINPLFQEEIIDQYIDMENTNKKMIKRRENNLTEGTVLKSLGREVKKKKIPNVVIS